MPGKSVGRFQQEKRKDTGYVNCPVCSALLLPHQAGTLKDGVYAGDCVNCGHFFKFKATNLDAAASTINFTVNGTPYNVGNEYSASSRLIKFLREERISLGTKRMCYEGGCGACLVNVKLLDPITHQKVEHSVNSCLFPLFAADGAEITTIEGLGNVEKGLHPIQDRLAKGDGAQCGYCSPAQVMNMYGLLKQKPKPTMSEVEDSFDATICRCTGYRPILDAMKSFAVDADKNLKDKFGGMVDIEELEAKLCKKSGQPCRGQCHSHNHGTPAGNTACHNSQQVVDRPVHIVDAGTQWFKPTSKADLVKLVKQYKDQNYRLVFGNTGCGVYKELSLGNYSILIDLRGVTEFYSIDLSKPIVLGANLSLKNLFEIFETSRKSATPLSYAGDFADHFRYVALQGIRNFGCWAGNLMMKHKHPDMQSDVCTMLETVGTTLTIMDENATETVYTFTDFLRLNMKGKVIVSMTLPTFGGSNVQVRTYRASQRLQASHCYVVSGFRMELDASQNCLVKSKPSIVMCGISGGFVHASLTEAYLVNKKLSDPTVLKGALATLASEIVPTTVEGQSSAAFRKNLAMSMFYKYCLDVCGTVVDSSYKSGGTKIDRPLMTGIRDYGTNKTTWPVSEAMPKTIGGYLTSGAAKFIDDVLPTPDQLYALPVLASVGNAYIKSIDASAALAIPGVKAFIEAKDIPGLNNWRPLGLYPGTAQELLSSGFLPYAGQPIGLIVADSVEATFGGVFSVKVEYKNEVKAVTHLREGVTQKRFFPTQVAPTVTGDPDGAIKAAKHVISNDVCVGNQFHFYMEAQTSLCTPNDVGGVNIQATTQWTDSIQETVSQILNIKQSEVVVELNRLGGAFGGKITQPIPVSALCALASKITGKTVKMHLDIGTTMKMLGKRSQYMGKYTVGVDDNGKLEGIDLTLYEDCGCYDNEAVSYLLNDYMDNAYHCANWRYTPKTVKLDKAVNTACRAPYTMPMFFIIETIMDNIADDLGLDPMDVRKVNLYSKGQSTPKGMILEYCTIREVVAQLEKDVKIADRKAAVEAFNKANRWKKRGIAMMPIRFPISYAGGMFNTSVAIYHGDGSVAISHGGIDCGQGINTKVIQIAAYEFGIPMDMIKVKKASSIINANTYTTGGSITTDLCAKGVLECCKILNARMLPVKLKMKNPSWTQLASKCQSDEVNLMASFMTQPDASLVAKYNNYCASVVEAEIDVLTGQYQLRQLDMLYDAGVSLNPELDMGQAEGGFLFGCGYLMNEELKYHSQTGAVLNATTWEYKPPFTKDLPVVYNIKIQRNSTNPNGVFSSKTSGEPPVTMASAAFMAIKHAVKAARADAQTTGYFAQDAPLTPDRIQALCLNDPTKYAYKPTTTTPTWRR